MRLGSAFTQRRSDGLDTRSGADLYNLVPTASGAVDQISFDNGLSYQSPSPGYNVGGGRGLSLVHQIVAYESFDFSGIKGQISQITLTGTLSNLSWPFGPDFLVRFTASMHI